IPLSLGERARVRVMSDDYRVIDADGHVLELDEILVDYLPQPWRDMEWHRSYSLWAGWDGYVRARRLARPGPRPQPGRLAGVPGGQPDRAHGPLSDPRLDPRRVPGPRLGRR